MVAALIAAAGYLLSSPRPLASADESDSVRLHRAILRFVTDNNPKAPVDVFRNFPGTLLAEAIETGIDHCIVLAQAQVESEFRHDAVGAAGEIGLYQIRAGMHRHRRGRPG
jgi:soluble lytic murein transglycosylase-like protein